MEVVRMRREAKTKRKAVGSNAMWLRIGTKLKESWWVELRKLYVSRGIILWHGRVVLATSRLMLS